MIKFNGRQILKNGWGINYMEPPTPPVPADMDFIYLAKNFNGTYIPNSVVGSTFGDYLQNGTLTVNDSGASCYLSNGLNDDNYLYKTLTSDQLDNIKALNNTYTWFIRMMQTNENGQVGGIMSTRSNGSYNYMIRCENNQLQFHGDYGTNLGSDFMLNVDRVYKVQVSRNSVIAKNLDTGVTSTLSTDSYRDDMGTKMTSFSAGFPGESYLDRFYGFAGIPRATTDAEDEAIKECLMNQSL